MPSDPAETMVLYVGERFVGGIYDACPLSIWTEAWRHSVALTIIDSDAPIADKIERLKQLLATAESILGGVIDG